MGRKCQEREKSRNKIDKLLFSRHSLPYKTLRPRHYTPIMVLIDTHAHL